MSKQHQNFHPRLLITGHFDSLINQIDIKIETLLENQSLTEEKRNELNELRDKQIEKIKEIEQINLQYLPLNINQEEHEEKWSHILQDKSLDYQQKIDQIKESDLIHFDCVLLENENGYELWITSWFYNQNNLEFLK